MALSHLVSTVQAGDGTAWGYFWNTLGPVVAGEPCLTAQSPDLKPTEPFKT